MYFLRRFLPTLSLRLFAAAILPLWLGSCSSTPKINGIPENLPEIALTGSAKTPSHTMASYEYPFDSDGNYMPDWAADGERRAGRTPMATQEDEEKWSKSHGGHSTGASQGKKKKSSSSAGKTKAKSSKSGRDSDGSAKPKPKKKSTSSSSGDSSSKPKSKKKTSTSDSSSGEGHKKTGDGSGSAKPKKSTSKSSSNSNDTGKSKPAKKKPAEDSGGGSKNETRSGVSGRESRLS